LAEDWITQEEAAKKLHVALDTMRRYVREGKFARVRVGKRYLIQSKSIEDFLLKGLEYGSSPASASKRSSGSGKTPGAKKSST